MKFKTQKEVKEETQDENKSNPIHEYLDLLYETTIQWKHIRDKFKPRKDGNKLYIFAHVSDLDTTTFVNWTEQMFNWIVPDVTIKSFSTAKDNVVHIFNKMSECIDKYNDLTLSNYELYCVPTICQYTFAEILKAYKDFQENPEEAEKKWFKCE
jgi:hypothetical protein